MKCEKLAIAIPTYNRESILKENLLFMMRDIKKYNIPIYISDDSNNNKTKDFISELSREYKYIFYNKNAPSLGHDNNCFKTLSLPKEDYIWYLGDSIFIQQGGLEIIMDLINHNYYDFIVTNHLRENLNLPTKKFTDAKEAFIQLSWHLTLTGSTIYSKRALDNYKKGSGIYKNFPQVSIVLNTITEQCNLFYESSVSTYPNSKKVSYWNGEIFDVFAKDWYNFISNLPDFYSEKEKDKVIKSHSFKTGIFGFKALLKYRLQGSLCLDNVVKYKKYLVSTSQVNYIIIIIISLLPIKIGLKKYVECKHLIMKIL